MIANSYTRVTLSLDIVRKIVDGPFAGYHELGIIKHKIDLHDVIEITDSHKMQLECNNSLVPCDETNICWKAALLLKERYQIQSNVKIRIEKNIPVMGGLAGGSANAATTLSMLSSHWNLNLTKDSLMAVGRTLGMDVPFYFAGDTAFDTEATGVIEPVLHKNQFTFVLAVPDFGVSTKDAYQGIDYSVIGKSIDKTSAMRACLIKGELTDLFSMMHNDFELTVFKKYPGLFEIKKQLLDAGCLASIMSGSGSTILGIVDNVDHAKRIQQSINCKILIASSYSEL